MPRNGRRARPAQPPADPEQNAADRRSAGKSHRAAPYQPQPSSAPHRALPPADRLRQARERAGLSFEVLVLRTKISRGMLEALETMNLDRLPANTYTRGFVIAYAREVGLDPEPTAADYLAEVGRKRDALRATVTATAQPAHGHVRVVDLNRDVSGTTGLLIMLGCAAALIVYVWAAGREATPAAAITPPAVESPVEPASTASDQPSTPTDAVPAASAEGPLRLELHAERECWVSATVDGRVVLSRLLKAGDRETLEATEGVTLRVGEPGALRYTINGRDGEPLGQPGLPVTVRITPANVHEFVS